MTPALESRLRRPDPTARLIIEAQAELAGADIRQTSVQWATADSLTGLTVLTDGGVQLSNGVTEVAGNPNGAGTYLPGLGVGNAVGVVNWFGVAEPGNFEVTFLTAYLNPRANVGNPRTAVKWRCRLYQPFYKDKNNTTAGITLIPLADAVDVAITADTAGDVTFDFRQLAQRPRPKAHNDYSANGPLNGAATFVVIEALDSTGAAAANVAWNQDPANATVAFFNYLATTLTLHANIIATDVNLTLDGLAGAGYPQFAGTGYIKIDTEIIGYTAVRIGGAFTGQLTSLQRGQFGTTAAGHTAGAAAFIASHNDISSATLAPSLVYPGTLARQATGGGAVRMTINTGAYSAATLRFSTTPVNLGAAPTAAVELAALAEVPLGASATFQVLKTGGSVGNPGDWLTYTDGMLTSDPSFGGLLTAAQTYKMQCILTPNAAGSVAPTLRALGARQVTRTDLTNVAQLKGGAWSFDPISLKSALNDFTLTAIRDGERDYHDAITTLLANTPIGNLLIRLFIGAPDLPRGSWLRLDDLVIDDFAPGAAATDLICQTGLSLVKQALPKFNTSASTRQPLAYPSIAVPTASLDKIWLDLLQNQLGDVLGARWVGQGLPAYQLPIPGPTGGTIVSNTAATPSVITTGAPHGRTGTFPVTIKGASDSAINGSFTATVVDGTHFSVPVTGAGGTGGTWFYAGGSLTTIIATKTITDTNTNPTPGRSNAADDAKMELDALAYIAGFVNITSQGKIKAVDVFGAQGVKVTFTPEAIRPTTIAAGLRQRQAEAFVAWGWNGSFYKGEAYGVNAAALAKLGNAYIDPTPLDDTICQWLVQQTGDPANQCGIANALATRIVNAFGTGLILWSFESNYAYPELEPGDLVAVPTDWFVASDPATGNAIAGPAFALGIVQSCEPSGRHFTVWVRGYSDILSAAQVGTRSGFATPTVVSGSWASDQNGNVQATVNCTGAAAVRMAVSTSAFPNAATVAGQALQTLDTTGYLLSSVLTTLTYGQTAYISVIAYENADGSGASSPLFEIQVKSVANWMNNQGSIPPTTSDASPLSYSSWCIAASSRAGIRWTWSTFTVYRADGSTITIPASSSLAAAPAPTLSQAAGGALGARTRCVRVALIKDKMMFGISAESTIAVLANQLFSVASPAAVAGYDGWIPLVGDAGLNNEVVQPSRGPTLPIAFGTNWTEPSGGASVPTGSNTQFNDDATALGAHDWNLTAGLTYWYYPCWDITNGQMSFAGGGAMTVKSNIQALRQNRDGYVSLAAAGPMSAATPAIGAGGSGAGGGGCLHPDTVVETPRGLRKLGELWIGATIRGRSGRWTRIMKYERRPQRAWIRLTVAGGERLTMTLTHPMTMLAGVKRAAELTMADLVHVPRGMAEIVELERLTLDGVDQIDVECEPEREFWAGERRPTILTHNTYVQS